MVFNIRRRSSSMMHFEQVTRPLRCKEIIQEILAQQHKHIMPMQDNEHVGRPTGDSDEGDRGSGLKVISFPGSL